MHTIYDDIEKLNPVTLFIWVLTLIVMLLGYRFIKNAVVFILVKLYELFIEHHAIN